PTIRRGAVDARRDGSGAGGRPRPRSGRSVRICRRLGARLRNVLRLQQAVVLQLLVVHAGDAGLRAGRVSGGRKHRASGGGRPGRTSGSEPTVEAPAPPVLRRDGVRRLLGLGAFFVVGWLSVPGDYHPPRTGLDPSWMVGLNLFAEEGFRFGHDVVFTYGPL